MLLSHKNEETQWQNLVILSRHLFVLKSIFFSESQDETLPCFVKTHQFVFEAPYNGCSTISPFISNSGTSRPPRNIFWVFFFLSGAFAFNCSPVYDEEQEVSFGRSPTVIPSFMTATLCVSPNFSPSESGCIVSFSPIVDPVDNDSLE